MPKHILDINHSISTLNMKIRLLLIIAISIAVYGSPLVGINYTFASCAEVDYNLKLATSELVFIGTVTQLSNDIGPQKVTFFIHETIKGYIGTQEYILKDTGKIFLEDGRVQSTSVSVNYTVGKTYKVYVENGETNLCTTKMVTLDGNQVGCLYYDEMEKLVPCKIDAGVGIGFLIVVFWPWIVVGVVAGIIFIVWKKRR